MKPKAKRFIVKTERLYEVFLPTSMTHHQFQQDDLFRSGADFITRNTYRDPSTGNLQWTYEIYRRHYAIRNRSRSKPS